MPKKWLREGMKDLVMFDQCKEELKLIKESNENLRNLNEKTTEFNIDLQEQKQQLLFRWQECLKTSEYADRENKKTIDNLNSQLKKQVRRATYTIVSSTLAGIVVGVVAGIILSK